MADDLLRKGIEALAGDFYQQAAALLSEAVAEDNTRDEIFLNRAQAYIKLEKWSDALADCDSCLVLNPSSMRAHMRRGVALYHLQRLDEARKSLLAAKQLDDHDPLVNQWLEKCEIAQEKSSVSQPPPAQKPIVRYDWYQTSSLVTITVLIKKLTPADVKHTATNKTLDVEVKIPESNFTWTQHWNLAHEIDSSNVNIKVLSTKVEIVVKKLDAIHWNALVEGSELDKLKTFTNSEKEPPVHVQSSNKWDTLAAQAAEEEKNEKLEGDAALQKLFQDIYSNGTDETKRAMAKSFSESGGTVLSTNWKDIGGKKTEIKPPDGMEFKKWDEQKTRSTDGS